MSGDTVLVAKSGGVTRLTLNRPDKLKAFNVEMHAELARRPGSCGRRRAMPASSYLTGAGRGFCAGQDLGDRVLPRMGAARTRRRPLEQAYNPLVRLHPPLPEAGGLRRQRHRRRRRRQRRARLRYRVRRRAAPASCRPSPSIGLVPDAGGTWVLPRLVGPARARGLAMLAEPLPADKADAWGLIWKAVADDEARGGGAALADSASPAARPYGFAPDQASARRSLRPTRFGPQLDSSATCSAGPATTPDYAEGVAAFLDKRAAKFTGRSA